MVPVDLCVFENKPPRVRAPEVLLSHILHLSLKVPSSHPQIPTFPLPLRTFIIIAHPFGPNLSPLDRGPLFQETSSRLLVFGRPDSSLLMPLVPLPRRSMSPRYTTQNLKTDLRYHLRAAPLKSHVLNVQGHCRDQGRPFVGRRTLVNPLWRHQIHPRCHQTYFIS